MAVKIRLMRTGSTNDACFRCVATDARTPRDGRCIEQLGWYDPKREGVNFQFKLDRIDHWVQKGAQVSHTVASLMRSAKRAAK